LGRPKADDFGGSDFPENSAHVALEGGPKIINMRTNGWSDKMGGPKAAPEVRISQVARLNESRLTIAYRYRELTRKEKLGIQYDRKLRSIDHRGYEYSWGKWEDYENFT